MADTLTSADLFLVWHEWSWLLAFGLLGLVFVLASLQLWSAGARKPGRILPGGSLRSSLAIAFVLIGTVPTAALGILLAERSAHTSREMMADRLERNAAVVARDVDHVLGMYVAGISTAASAVSDGGKFDTESLQRALLLNHETYGNFLTMLATDRYANIVAATSNMTGFLTQVDDLSVQNVQDRPYFRMPMNTGEPFISEAFKGRGLGNNAIVAISAPLFDANGQPNGVLEGSLNLAAFNRLKSDRASSPGRDRAAHAR